MSVAVTEGGKWASRICAAWQQSFDSIIEVGKLLIEAKGELPHGQFEAMVEHELPFDASTAQRLMKVARDERFSNPAHGQLLPPSWRTLYELTQLDDEEFESKLADGTIHPEMQRKDVTSIARRPASPDPFVAPAPRLPSPEEALELSRRTGERVQARDGCWYSDADMHKRDVEDRIQGFCDFAASLIEDLSDPRFVELCREPETSDRVKAYAERVSEAAWRFVGRLEAT